MANNWTREQLIVAFNLYCKIPFSKSVQTNPAVIRVANLIGRTPAAVAFKLGNFGSFDPALRSRGIGGLPNASRLDRQIWDEFANNWEELSFQSEQIVANLAKVQPASPRTFDMSHLPEGTDRETTIRVRVNQTFFRQSVLSIYGSRCCVTGLDHPSLLVASHIVPWSRDQKNRTNPQNGLCLNSLHDRAFDAGLITITEDFKVKVSAKIAEAPASANFFAQFDGKPISLPDKFLPDIEFILFHNKEVFQP